MKQSSSIFVNQKRLGNLALVLVALILWQLPANRQTKWKPANLTKQPSGIPGRAALTQIPTIWKKVQIPHDASGLEVGPQEDGIWMTWRTTELLGRENTEAYQSHDLQLFTVCAHYHFNDNPWQLNPDVEVVSQ